MSGPALRSFHGIPVPGPLILETPLTNDHPRRGRGSFDHLDFANTLARRAQEHPSVQNWSNLTRRFMRLAVFGVVAVAGSAAVILQHCGGKTARLFAEPTALKSCCGARHFACQCPHKSLRMGEPAAVTTSSASLSRNRARAIPSTCTKRVSI